MTVHLQNRVISLYWCIDNKCSLHLCSDVHNINMGRGEQMWERGNLPLLSYTLCPLVTHISFPRSASSMEMWSDFPCSRISIFIIKCYEQKFRRNSKFYVLQWNISPVYLSPPREIKYRKLFNRRLFRIEDWKNRENSDFYLVKTDKISNTRLFQKFKN